MKIILGSSSPRRQKFLEEIGVEFSVEKVDVDESYPENLKEEQITNYIAEEKSKPFVGRIEKDQLVVTSDTLVMVQDKVLGKPKNYQEAFQMLKLLSGKTHCVITSVCFTTQKNRQTFNSKTYVTFKELEEAEIHHYIENYKPFDKAGGYAIQEWIGIIGITKIEGSYNNVVGLPTHIVYREIKKFKESL